MFNFSVPIVFGPRIPCFDFLFLVFECVWCCVLSESPDSLLVGVAFEAIHAANADSAEVVLDPFALGKLFLPVLEHFKSLLVFLLSGLVFLEPEGVRFEDRAKEEGVLV